MKLDVKNLPDVYPSIKKHLRKETAEAVEATLPIWDMYDYDDEFRQCIDDAVDLVNKEIADLDEKSNEIPESEPENKITKENLESEFDNYKHLLKDDEMRQKVQEVFPMVKYYGVDEDITKTVDLFVEMVNEWIGKSETANLNKSEKLTAQNFLEEFPKVKSKIAKVVEAYPTVYEDFEFYNDDNEIKEAIDLFIEKANNVLESETANNN